MTDTIPGAELRAFIERAERLIAERRDLNDDLAEVFAVAEEEAIIEMYLAALGMI